MDGEARVLDRLLTALGCDGVLLAREALSGHDLAVLEHHGPVSEDEVHGACDVALAVELALGVGVEGVLVAVDGAAVEDREVGVRTEGHGLVLLGAGRVLEGYVPCDEPLPFHGCTNNKTALSYLNCLISERVILNLYFKS